MALCPPNRGRPGVGPIRPPSAGLGLAGVGAFYRMNVCRRGSLVGACARCLWGLARLCGQPPFSLISAPLKPCPRWTSLVPNRARTQHRAEGSPGVSEGCRQLCVGAWCPEGGGPHSGSRPAVRRASEPSVSTGGRPESRRLSCGCSGRSHGGMARPLRNANSPGSTSEPGSHGWEAGRGERKPVLKFPV